MRRKGIIGNIYSLITFIIWAALFVALLSRFDFDIVRMVEWIVLFIWDIILRLANLISRNDSFRSITSVRFI